MISLALARLLGAEGYGAYSFALACVGLLSVPALLGFDGLLVREVARYLAREHWASLTGLLRRARQMTLVASFGLALAGAGLAWAFSGQLERPMLTAFWIALFALPFLAQTRVIQATMIGLRRITAAQVPETAFQPALFLALIAATALLLAGRLDAQVAVGLYGVSALAAFFLATGLWRRARKAVMQPAAPEYATGAWLRSAVPFALTSGLNVLGTSLGVLMLAPMQGAHATGIFGVAMTASNLITLPLAAINTPLAPRVAQAYADNDRAALRRLTTHTARVASLVSLPLFSLFILFGTWVLSLFGPEFAVGHAALLILASAQMFNVAVGPVGLLLQMTGHERDVLASFAISAAITFVANLLLIPLWGGIAAAIGAAAGVILSNLILLILV
ncbi:MAG: oligosaccharide flippase family protein, partial [Proteobacteria bacterium]|nr:oligosaccharide flippase family protein [Pseudomonadota bacterium]